MVIFLIFPRRQPSAILDLWYAWLDQPLRAFGVLYQCEFLRVSLKTPNSSTKNVFGDLTHEMGSNIIATQKRTSFGFLLRMPKEVPCAETVSYDVVCLYASLPLLPKFENLSKFYPRAQNVHATFLSPHGNAETTLSQAVEEIDENWQQISRRWVVRRGKNFAAW